MTRAKRYANHKGGRKYDKETGEELKKSAEHKDAAEKLEASNVFREAWEECKNDKVYGRLKAEFMKEQKEWDQEARKRK
jgi:hypothetical protein